MRQGRLGLASSRRRREKTRRCRAAAPKSGAGAGAESSCISQRSGTRQQESASCVVARQISLLRHIHTVFCLPPLLLLLPSFLPSHRQTVDHSGRSERSTQQARRDCDFDPKSSSSNSTPARAGSGLRDPIGAARAIWLWLSWRRSPSSTALACVGISAHPRS